MSLASPLLAQGTEVPARAARAQSFGLLFAALVCLVMLQVRMKRRKHTGESRLAESLAAAFHGGIFTDDEARRPGLPLWCLWIDPEEPEEPEPEAEQIVSRYRLLGYSPETAQPQASVVSIRQFGADPDPFAPLTDEKLTLGIPREFLRERESQEDAASAEPPRAMLDAAAGDEPGEGIPDLDLLACRP
jgi:hypothetical protein